MTALRPIADFTGSTVTEGQFKAALGDLRAYLSGLLGEDGQTTTALQALGAMCGDYIEVTAARTVAASERGFVFGCTGTLTLSLPGALSVGTGFAFCVVNTGTGTLTIDPAGTQLIDGLTTINVQPGHGGIVVCEGTRWRTIGVLGTKVTQNRTDVTRGRLLKAGDFGLGTGTGEAVPQVTLSTAVAVGTFQYTGTDPDSPTGQSGMLEISRFSAASVRQVASPANSFNRFQRTSSNDGGSWTGWRPIYTTANVVGAVSDLGGQPNGAIIEAGSNANGFWTKWADGTMECWREAEVDVTSVALQTFAAPVAFAGLRETIAGSFSQLTSSVNLGLRTKNIEVMGFTSAWFVRLETAYASVDPSDYSEKLMFRAIGRWM